MLRQIVACLLCSKDAGPARSCLFGFFTEISIAPHDLLETVHHTKCSSAS